MSSLEGLRGLATLIVVFTHIQQFFFPEALQQLSTLFSVFPTPLSLIADAFFKAFFNGKFAVLTFWVLSGFVLSYRYFLLLPDNFTKAQQYLIVAAIKRYFRLAVPVLVSVLIAFLLFNANLMSNKALAQYYLMVHSDWQTYTQWLAAFYSFEPGFINALKSALWDTFVEYDRASSYNAVLWTMEKEFIGSLFLFVFLGFLGWVGHHRTWLWVVVIFLLTWVRLHWVTAFLLGAWLCSGYCFFRTHSSSVSSMGIKRGFVIFNNPFVSVSCVLGMWVLVGLPNYLGVAYLAIALALVALSLISKPLTQWLSVRPLLFLGRISFGIYLGHFLLIASFSSRLYLIMIDHWLGFVVAASVAVFTLLLSLPLGWLIYRLGDVGGKRLADSISQFIFRRMSRIV